MNGRVNNEVAKALMQIAEGMSRKGNWAGYTYRDEMRQNAIVKMLAAVFKFDPDKSDNPFGYFSMIAHNAFLAVLKREKDERATVDALSREIMGGGIGHHDRKSTVQRSARQNASHDGEEALEHILIGPAPVTIEWRPCPSYPGLEVTEAGEIRQADRLTRSRGGGWRHNDARALARSPRVMVDGHRVRWSVVVRDAWPLTVL